MAKVFEKDNFVVTLNLEDRRDGDRYWGEIVFEITDDGKPFHRSTLEYPDCPPAVMDGMEIELEKIVQVKLPYTSPPLTEREMLKLEKKMIELLKRFNDMARNMVAKSTEEKNKLAMGQIRGKERRAKGLQGR